MKGDNMKIIIIAIICLGLGFAAGYIFLTSSKDVGTESHQTDEQLYTCGMHPDIVSDEPGICPICNMKLTPKRESGTETGGIKVSPETKQNMGLVTTPVVYRSIGKSVSTFGKVVIPDPNNYQVTVKTEGWVERLFVSETGEQVFRGQPLFEIYSPDIVAAQKELLVALSEPDNLSMQRLANSAKRRLKNWDISDDQLSDLEQSGEISRTIIIRSPSDGFINRKNIDKGTRVEPKKVLYEIIDLSEVWIEAHIYEQDLSHIFIKQSGHIAIPALSGQVFDGYVSYISPLLSKKGQIEIRLQIGNPELLLKPEMYAEVTLDPPADNPVLAIPRKAVINSGKRQLVYVSNSDNAYEPREIVTGTTGRDDMVEVVSGLGENDNVVVSGQFLIDSESRLSESVNSSTDLHQHVHQDQAVLSDSDDPYDIHTCPMPEHSHILNYGPGQCSECNMDLVPIIETDHDPVYVCPMPRCGPISLEPGECSHCGMILEEHLPGGHDDK